MARRSSIPFDDIAKAIAKAMGQATPVVAPRVAKGAKKAVKGAKKAVKAKPKTPKIKGQKRFVDARETPTIKGTFTSRGNVADIKQAYNVKTREPVIKGEWKAPKEAPKKDPKKVKSVRSGTDAPTTKGPKGKPERPRMTRGQYLERQANRTLRRADGRPQPRVDDPRAGVAPNIPRVPKRSKAKPKGPRSSYEADKTRAEIAADRRRFSGTRPKPKKS